MNNEPLVHQVTDDEVQGKTKAIFEQTKLATGGKVPKWMRVMANCDDVFLGFFDMFKATMDNEPTSQILKWKIAYKISEINKCEFCVSVTESQLKQLGLKGDEISDIDKTCNKQECLAVEYAIAATEHAYNIDPKLFTKMKEEFSDAQIVEITSVVGLFSFINRFNDSLGVLPDIN